jgi:tetratricopeptide (TPR) repeat protein
MLPHSRSASLTSAPVKAPLSPRRRRLRWTGRILAVVTALSIGLGFLLYWKSRPKQYRPDEKEADITSSLSRSLPKGAPMPRFRDVTRDAGLASFRTFIGNRTSQLPEDMGAGVAWGDFNNDGLDDVFLVSAGGPLNFPTEKLAPCELYENLGNGTFRKVEGFPETRIHGMAAAWADYDGDGYLDLILTGFNTTLLFHNEGGTGKFVRDTRFPNLPGFWSSASWGDYDNDRRPDLYLCNYVQYNATAADRDRLSSQLGTAVPYTLNPSSFEPGLNRLFHNNGDGTFTDVSEALHVTDATGRSLGALWHDFDDDGWLDLYVANDISENVLYHNVRGHFEDIGKQACVAEYRSSMGLAAGDYDRDGDDDLFIGHWIGQENALYDNLWADLNRTVQPQPAGTVPDGFATAQKARTPRLSFTDVADLRGLGQIALAYVSWGAEFVDFDGDGWLDLVVANGNTIEAEGPPPRKLKPQETFLFWNDHGQFFNLAPHNKSLSEPHDGRGLAVADYDNDGAMDILISFLGEGVQLLRNEMQTGHWVKLRLRSRLANGAPLGFGDGAKVIAHIGDIALRRTVSSVSYLSQSSRTVHFGLGNVTKVDQLEVRWLGGPTNFYDSLAADATWEITEGEPAPKRFVAQALHGPAAHSTSASDTTTIPAVEDKSRVVEFWNRLRAAMNAAKVEKDNPKAIGLFRAALELQPDHEDAHYYLGQCLAAEGDYTDALEQFQALTRINPNSHRGFQQWGIARACSATNDTQLAEAETALEQAHHLNPEETGALLAMGEVSTLRQDWAKADKRFAAACQTNTKSVVGLFLRGYLAWRRGDSDQARRFLAAAREARGNNWQPKGTTSEGDVKRKQHLESSPLARYWSDWDGNVEPERAYAALATGLKLISRPQSN